MVYVVDVEKAGVDNSCRFPSGSPVDLVSGDPMCEVFLLMRWTGLRSCVRPLIKRTIYYLDLYCHALTEPKIHMYY